MNLYTFIMDFREGTYISQVDDFDEYKALVKWAKSLNIKEIQYLSNATKQQLIDSIPELIAEQELTKINTVKNVWYFDFQFKTGLANIHVVKTM